MLSHLIILLGLVKLLQVSESPLLCAGIYGIVAFLFAGLAGTNFGEVAVAGLIAFASSFIYFWLLKRFWHSFWWWVVLIGGVLVGLI